MCTTCFSDPGGSPYRDPPWTKTPLDRDPPGQRPPEKETSGQRPPGQRPPEGPWDRGQRPPRGKMGPGSQTGNDIMQRPLCGQNDRHM